ncbi:lamin tail domain-containing protein [Owenweeksia hongkongensis]|uniref:lamin tail domain-containing protein n=1 Tax=Owenweeksia hongkongensis TaxID=253245 RepID=UPI003A944A09
MRTALIILLLPVFCFSQITVSDDFSDGDFMQNPNWVGDTGKFIVNPNFQLQLNDNAAGSSYLSSVSEVIDNAIWEFYVKMDFNPSASNYAKVCLVADKAGISGSFNGYYVRLGGSSDDRISLYRQDGVSSVLVAESGDDWLDIAAVEVSVKVTRDSLGFWVLSADTSGATNYVALDSASDATYIRSQYFGVECIYTSTRSDKFYFDDFSILGNAYNDNQPAAIVGLTILDSSSLCLEFSEAMDSSSASDISNYQGSGNLGLPVSAVFNQSNFTKVDLAFSSVFQINKQYYLNVNDVTDLFGNTTHDTLPFIRFQAVENQIVITELMPDPSPVVGVPPNALPEREYLELYNNSSLSIDLKDWVLRFESTDELLPSYILDSGEFVVVTKDIGVAEFPQGIPVLGLDMSSTALTNSGTSVSLISPKGVFVNSVTYTDDWYNDANKENGGWSLELIDIGNPCGEKENWTASVNPMGGTPGMKNSVAGVNPDTISPAITRVAILGDSSIGIFFSERIDELLLADSSNYVISPSITIQSMEPDFISYTSIVIRFGEKIKEETLYNLWVSDLLLDCKGNALKNDTVIFAIPSIPEEGEVLINEVLFNPYPEGSDFVELYNYSEKVFDLNKLLLGNWNSVTKSVENVELISNESYLFGPGEYVAIAADVGFLNENYKIENKRALLKSDAVPSMPDAEGSVALVSSDLSTICDYLEYNDEMHLSVLQSEEGVSLERISFAKSSQDEDNWHSAAEGLGFATPGYLNSMAYQSIFKGTVSLDPKVFSPNQDGYKDVLNINYSFEQAGNIVSITIWNSAGMMVRELQENTNVGQEGFFTWDGTDDNSQLLNSGIYIIVLEYFNPNGDRQIFKETCVLSL